MPATFTKSALMLSLMLGLARHRPPAQAPPHWLSAKAFHTRQ